MRWIVVICLAVANPHAAAADVRQIGHFLGFAAHGISVFFADL
jgi:hypothetical protein